MINTKASTTVCQLNVIFAFMFKKHFLPPYSIVLFSFFIIFCHNVSISVTRAQIPTSKNVLPTNVVSHTKKYSFLGSSLQSHIGNLKTPASTTLTTSSVPVETVITNAGTDVRLNCTSSPVLPDVSVAWIRQSANETNFNGTTHSYPQPFPTNPKDGSITLLNISAMHDGDIYTCIVAYRKKKIIHLKVKSTPLAVADLSVISHSVYALVTWNMPIHRQGGFPVKRYVLLCRLNKTNLSINDGNSSWSSDVNLEELDGNSSKLSADFKPSSIPEEEYHWKGIILVNNVN